MAEKNLMRSGRYSREWVKGFYDQAHVWWGPDPQEEGTHEGRLDAIRRHCGTAARRVLDLGAGSGMTAATLADAGYDVTAVEINDTDAATGRQLEAIPRAGKLSYLQGDFYDISLAGRFDVITCWQVFGIGSDADQRTLLRRIAHEWLAPGGMVLIDIYTHTWPILNAGKQWQLDPLPGVPGSVGMIERCHYDAVHGRWIDEWVPVNEPEKALSQSVRCYSPAELLMLIEHTGLRLACIDLEGKRIDPQSDEILLDKDIFNAWGYLAVFQK